MKLGIDISTVLNFGINVGSGRYIINLLNGLFCLASENKKQSSFKENKEGSLKDYKNDMDGISFILTGRYSDDSNVHHIEDLIAKYPDLKIKLKLFRFPQDKIDKWDKRGFPPIELKGFKTDILHCPDYIIPPSINKNIVLTIHDLSFYRFPEFNFDWFIKKYQAMVLKNAKRAKIIIADSQSTRQDIIDFMKIDPQKIKVVYLAADRKFKVLAPGQLKSETPEKFNISKKFILNVGTIEPRKNLKTLIKAFNIFKNNYSSSKDFQLVIAGKTGWKSEETFDEYKKSPYKDEIIFTGEVNDEDLVQLYNQASLFVYPSIFEGFGLPVLEAMSCALPVIATDTSSVPEVYPNEEFLLDPFDEKKMAQKINLVLADNNKRDDLIKFSIENSKKFSWEKSALETLQIYSQLYNC
ncbi:MAG: glycosyltransferase family 4 protein [Candidatus Humimicrobiaceae bacterium]